MNRMKVRRAAYVVAALATVISGVSGGWGFLDLMSAARLPIGRFWPVLGVTYGLAGGLLLLLAGAFLYLARRPQGWGKLLCIVGLPWMAFSAMNWISSQVVRAFPSIPMLLGPGACGAVLVLVGVVLIVVDRGRFLAPLPE